MEQAIHDAVEAFRRSVESAIVGELSFPVSLDASRRVLKAVENPDIGAVSLAKVLVAEPLLSAKVIRLANSAALSPNGQHVSDVRQAVLRVGIDPIKVLATVLIMDQLRHGQRNSVCRELSDRLWERTVYVAALSFVVAGKMTRLNPDEAMFAGIVHDLGRFYLLSKAADFPALIESRKVLAETINDLAARVAPSVLAALDLPPAVVDAVAASRVCQGAMPPETLGDLLFVARKLSPRSDPFDEFDARQASCEESAVALGLDQGTVAEVIAASGDEIYSIVVALES